MTNKNEKCICGSLKYKDAHLKGDGKVVYCTECGTIRMLMEVK